MARELHIFLYAMAAASLAGACVIPPPLDLEAGNTPPQVIPQGTIPNPDPREEVVVWRTKPAAPTPVVQYFVIRFYDPDPESVWLRLFISADYTSVVDEREAVPPSETSNGERVEQFTVEGLCDGLLKEPPDVEVYLTDTAFVRQGNDLRITTTVDGRKGARDHVRWRIKCDDEP